jgi:hypothetical protein
MQFRLLALVAMLLLAAAPCAGQTLEVWPAEVKLPDPFARQQLLARAGVGDVTSQATFASSAAAIVAVQERGYLVPLADGEATITATYGGASATVKVTVSGLAQPRAVDFQGEVVPLLSRHGCNTGGCHGKASGQNGFKLSLFGFDGSWDYDEITKRGRGRRIIVGAPDHSLLLAKATNLVPHGGGRRIEPDGEAYHMIRAWIAAGAPPSAANQPRITSLQLMPREAALKTGQCQQLAVTAIYSDGSQRDVTRQCDFSSNLDVVARVDEQGLVTAAENRGEATIMARYMGQVAVFTALAPHGEPLAEIPGFVQRNYVDQLCAEKWKRLGLVPSPVCDDATFIRRVTIDLCGRLPTAEGVRGFLADTSAEKRTQLVDRLLDSPDYPAYFAMRWGTILRNSQLAGANQASYAFHNWIKDSIARNQPYDQFVRGIVAASGEWQDAPAINWLWQNRDDQLHQTTADVAQVFLGTRLQCARCHHHPYERFSQEDYYGLAGFFTRMGRKSFGEPPPYFASPNVQTGEKNPLTDKTPEPKYLDGEYAKFSPEEDPRHALVDWMARPDNPYFAKALVNRLWGHFFGRGIVHEVDDLRQTNPPSNPELLDTLARNFVEHKFDVKHLIRTLVTSQAYQLSSEPTGQNEHDQQNFARYYARRMPAEVFLDAVDQATGTKTRFGGVAASSRAVDLPHEGFGSYFLDAFDRPRRVTTCECERSSGATLAQVLLLANSDEVENKLAAGDGKIAKLVETKRPTKEIVEELFLGAFSRPPREAELTAALAAVASAGQNNERQALEDVLWTLLNSREFMFNH